MAKTCRCFICTGTPARWKCKGVHCYTNNQCCREIIDASFTLEEWIFFRNVVDYAMLEVNSDYIRR